MSQGTTQIHRSVSMVLQNGPIDPNYQPKHLRKDSCADMGEMGEFQSESESRILVLYTGGTIGMKNINGVYHTYPNYLVQSLRKQSIFHDPDYKIRIDSADVKPDPDKMPLVMPESKDGRRIVYTVWEYEPLLDSCNMTMTDWARLAMDIENSYQQFDGFVVLHGTDTMAYTASALSFMLENQGKPVVLTGSQIPIFETRSDGRDNFLGALIMAGTYSIPEVTVYFNNKLLRGNRTTKFDSGSLDAFHSHNLRPLAELEIDIHVNWSAVYRQSSLEKFAIHTNMNPHVAILRLFPSITTQTVSAFLQPPMEGVVIQTYGAGNGPDSRADLMKIFQEARDRECLLINITQCPRGAVSVSYATGEALFKVGIIPGADMTPEGALTKLSYVLGKKGLSYAEKTKMMSSNIRGEMRVLEALEESSSQILLTEIPLVEKLQEALKISSEQEVNMLRNSVYPSLLCSAAYEGNSTKLQQLLEAGAMFNQCDYDGRTALHVAASEGHVEVVEFLLLHGAPVHQRDRYGSSPLDDAVRFNQFETIKLLVKTGAHLTVRPFKLGTLLCHAAMTENGDSLNAWYTAEANLDQGDYDQRTALHLAVSHGNVETVRFLMDHGCNPTKEDSFGKTALDEEKVHPHQEIKDLLNQSKDLPSSPASDGVKFTL